MVFAWYKETLVTILIYDIVTDTTSHLKEFWLVCFRVQFQETQDPIGPYGAKGVGEPSLIPMAPAVANAIHDAVGVRITDLPITAEKVFFALYPECEGSDL